MAYSVNGGISIAEKSDVKKLQSDLSKVTNASKVLHTDIAAIKSEQSIQGTRLNNIEKATANKEFTPLEIQQMWGD